MEVDIVVKNLKSNAFEEQTLSKYTEHINFKLALPLVCEKKVGRVPHFNVSLIVSQL